MAPTADHACAPPGVPPSEEMLKRVEASILVLRGQDLKFLGQPDAARACFQKALSLDPNNQTAPQETQ
jgi:tetratricopeptide (TPR) repeat protein